jgi:hypothetical protein
VIPAQRESIKAAIKQVLDAGETICDAKANAIALAHGLPVGTGGRQVMRLTRKVARDLPARLTKGARP